MVMNKTEEANERGLKKQNRTMEEPEKRKSREESTARVQ